MKLCLQKNATVHGMGPATGLCIHLLAGGELFTWQIPRFGRALRLS